MTLIPIDRILPNPEQPRIEFDPEELMQLANSIRENGVIQPIIIEQTGDSYILHDGERRLRAAKLAGLADIPASVIPPLNGSGPQDRLIRAIVANIQRSDLSPIEEARAYARLRDEHGLTVREISRRLGTYEARISLRLALLELDQEIQELIHKGRIPTAQPVVAAFRSIANKEARIKLAQTAAERRSSIKTIVIAAARVATQFENKRTVKPTSPPAISHALAKSKKALTLAKWDALHQIGQVPPWPAVVDAAQVTCRACLWRSAASEAVCRECPLPNAISTMIENAMSREVV